MKKIFHLLKDNFVANCYVYGSMLEFIKLPFET